MCTDKGCLCEPYYSGEDCSSSFVQEVGKAPFYAFMTIVCLIHVVVLVLYAVDFILRFRVTNKCNVFNYRDMSSFACMVACVLRVAWLIDSDVTSANLTGDVMFAVLLRLP